MSKHRRYQLSALLLVLLSAVVRLPMEQAITQDFREKELLPMPLDTNLREQMTQESFTAAAGGLRSLLASYCELEAFTHFYEEPPRWELVDKGYALCCQLQPRVFHYWEMHGWMMASNAAEYYATEHGAVPGMEAEMRRFYREKGLKICEDGIQHNPETYKSYRQAADMLTMPIKSINPHPDFKKAAEYYLLASECPDAQLPPSYPKRFLYRSHLYCLAEVPGKEAEAYKKLRELFESSPKENFRTTRTKIRALEAKLKIPLPAAAVFHDDVKK